MNDLRISVIIPTYNRAHLVTRTVASALSVAAPDDEVIVIDDGSTDQTADVLAQFGSRIRYVPVPHGGAGAARNQGVRTARNPLVAFLDSDDEWMPDKLQLQRALMRERPDVLFCFSDFYFRYDSGLEQHRYLARWHKDPRGWDEILNPGVPYSSIDRVPAGRGDFSVHIGDLYLNEMRANYVCTSTLVVRREMAGDTLRFPEDLPTYEDTECYGRLARAGLAAYLDCETAWHWGHREPRLTHADEFVSGSVRLTILERVWGSDEQFLSQHGSRYARAVAAQHLKRARWLIKQGRTREARQELRHSDSAPMSYRALAALPGWMIPLGPIQALRTLRRELRSRGHWL